METPELYWTPLTPTKEGWYWTRRPNEFPPFVIFFKEGKYMINSQLVELHGFDDFEFYGPVEVPE